MKNLERLSLLIFVFKVRELNKYVSLNVKKVYLVLILNRLFLLSIEHQDKKKEVMTKFLIKHVSMP